MYDKSISCISNFFVRAGLKRIEFLFDLLGGWLDGELDNKKRRAGTSCAVGRMALDNPYAHLVGSSGEQKGDVTRPSPVTT